MISMQYSVTLPGKYDMDSVRERVRLNGYKADRLPFLIFKTFLISEKGKDGNTANRYAPFYVWDDARGMSEIVLGDFFQGIVESYGWQKIDTNMVFCFERRNMGKAKYAVNETMAINDYTDLKAMRKRETNRHEKLLQRPGVEASVVGYNAWNWTLTRFYMVDQLTEADFQTQCIRYDVLHISEAKE